jgi:hypothetical protein
MEYIRTHIMSMKVTAFIIIIAISIFFKVAQINWINGIQMAMFQLLEIVKKQ